VALHVVSELDESPIPDARVTWQAESAENLQSTSDGAGIALLGPVREAVEVQFRVEAEGFEPATGVLSRATCGAAPKVRLSGANRLAGIVTGPDDGPVPYAHVEVQMQHVTVSTTTSSDGRFAVAALPRGTARVGVRAEGYAESVSHAQTGRPEEIRISLAYGYTCKVSVSIPALVGHTVPVYLRAVVALDGTISATQPLEFRNGTSSLTCTTASRSTMCSVVLSLGGESCSAEARVGYESESSRIGVASVTCVVPAWHLMIRSGDGESLGSGAEVWMERSSIGAELFFTDGRGALLVVGPARDATVWSRLGVSQRFSLSHSSGSERFEVRLEPDLFGSLVVMGEDSPSNQQVVPERIGGGGLLARRTAEVVGGRLEVTFVLPPGQYRLTRGEAPVTNAPIFVRSGERTDFALPAALGSGGLLLRGQPGWTIRVDSAGPLTASRSGAIGSEGVLRFDELPAGDYAVAWDEAASVLSQIRIRVRPGSLAEVALGHSATGQLHESRILLLAANGQRAQSMRVRVQTDGSPFIPVSPDRDGYVVLRHQAASAVVGLPDRLVLLEPLKAASTIWADGPPRDVLIPLPPELREAASISFLGDLGAPDGIYFIPAVLTTDGVARLPRCATRHYARLDIRGGTEWFALASHGAEVRFEERLTRRIQAPPGAVTCRVAPTRLGKCDTRWLAQAARTRTIPSDRTLDVRMPSDAAVTVTFSGQAGEPLGKIEIDF
jgi:hypothetical protein